MSDKDVDISSFNDFILEEELVDLPWVGLRLTWTIKDVSSMSRLEIFLLSKQWLGIFSNNTRKYLKRGVYDDCPIWLSNDEVN